MNPIQWIAGKIADLGLDLYLQTSFVRSEHHSVNGQPLVIRVAYCARTAGGHKRWQWNIPNAPKKSVLILIAVDEDGEKHAYVIPWEIAKLRTRYEVSSHPTRHKGMIAPFLNKWEIIADAVGEREVAA